MEIYETKGGHVLTINSSLLITNNLLGHSKLTYKDFTPLATLASDWEVVVVSKDSNIENAKQLMEQLKQNKKNFKIGVARPRKRRSPILRTSKQSIWHKPCRTTILCLRKQRKIINALTNKQIGAATMTLSEAENNTNRAK